MNFINKNNEIIVILLIISIILIIIFYYISNKKRQSIEGAKNLNKVFREIKKIGKIGKQINNAFKKIGKLEKIFTQIPKALDKALVKPFLALFVGLGNVFVQLFNILKKIGNKIVSLPGCILYFVINNSVDATLAFISWLTPNWIERPFKAIWKPTIGRIISWFLNWIGYSSSLRKCLAFNVNEELAKMGNNFKKIGKEFRKNFGKIKIKI
jgi:predicted PurR-regulated permease PerM